MVECLTTQRTSILIVSLARSQKVVGSNPAPANSFFLRRHQGRYLPLLWYRILRRLEELSRTLCHSGASTVPAPPQAP